MKNLDKCFNQLIDSANKGKVVTISNIDWEVSINQVSQNSTDGVTEIGIILTKQ